MNSHNTNAKAKKGEIVLFLRGVGKSAGKLDPFEVGETVRKAINSNAGAKEDGHGNYILRARSEEQALKLTRLKKLGDGTKIKIDRHATLNTVKCIIQSRLITDMPDDKLALRLQNQGVVKVRSIRPENRLKILHVTGTKVPPSIMIGLIKVRTETYYGMPKVCRNCKQIGHITDACEGGLHCGNCSGVHATNKVCKRSPHCVNCGGNHQPMEKACPLYVQEKAIIKIQVDQKIGPYQARRVFMKKANRYIPLPAEGKANETDSDGSETGSEKSQESGTDSDPEEEMSASIKEAQATPMMTKTKPPGGVKRKPKVKPGKPEKRRSTRLSSSTDDDDAVDFLAAADIEQNRVQKEAEKLTSPIL